MGRRRGESDGRSLLRVAKDDMVLETAVNRRVDTIVTFNTGDFGDAPHRFGIVVSRPINLLRRL